MNFKIKIVQNCFIVCCLMFQFNIIEIISSATVSPLCSSAIKDILTCDECGERFSKSGLYLAHIRTRAHLGCNLDNIDQNSIQKISVQERQYPSPRTIAKAHADSIRKTKSYNTVS